MTTLPDATRASSNRDTFLSGQDVLDRVRQLLGDLGEMLEEESRKSGTPETASALDALDRERTRILSDTLSDFEQVSPAATRRRMQQYSAALPTAMLRPPNTHSPHALAAWMSATIDRFGSVFDEIAASCGNERIGEPFALLAIRMRAHARRIARISIEALETAEP